MQSTNKFIVKPKDGNHFINEKEINGHKIIINTSIESASNVNRVGIIQSLPLEYDGIIKVNDEVILQHNIFRDYFNIHGITKKSSFHIKDDLFFVPHDLIYLVKKGKKYKAIDNYCFVQPIYEEKRWEGKILQKHLGVVKFGNTELIQMGIYKNDKVVFEQESEYEFEINDEILYRMRTNMILAKVLE